MACSTIGIPPYLHYSEGERKKYKPNNFRSYHLAYRTGFEERKSNPIEFPNSLTAFSVCWSKLIERSDVLFTVRSNAKNPESMGNHVYFGKIGLIKDIWIKGYFDARINKEAKHPGYHVIEPEFSHTPMECNYSHSEIMIKHSYHLDGKLNIEIITKKQYEDRKCALRKKINKDVFQPMINEYEAKLGTLLNSSTTQLDIPFFLKLFPPNLIVSLSLWKAILVKNIS
jgi:hypothetical protein